MTILSGKIDQKNDFLAWLVDFHKNGGGGFFPNNPSEWFDNVESSHKGLREFLGGIRKESEIKLVDEQGLLPVEEARMFVDQILDATPVARSYIEYNSWNLFGPTCKDERGRTVKTAKHVRSVIAKHIKNLQFKEEDAKETIKRIDKILSTLGERWAAIRTTANNMQVKMTTSASAFALLGHHVTDKDSCFRQRKENDWNKYALGQTPDTFVMLINKNGHRLARYWGFTNKQYNVVNVCNGYVAKGTQMGDAQAAISQFLGDLWKTDKISLVQHHVEVDRGVYHNKGRPDWTFYTTPKIQLQNLVPVMEGIRDYVICHSCRQEWATSETDIIDGHRYCKDCGRGAGQCCDCGARSFDIKKTAKIFSTTTHLYIDMHICDTCSIKDTYKTCERCNCLAYNTKPDGKPFICTSCISEISTMIKRLKKPIKPEQVEWSTISTVEWTYS